MADWTDELMNELKFYTDEVVDKSDKIIKKKSKELAEKISVDSPEDSGEYKKGWKVQKVQNNAMNTEYVVYQAKKPSLTHLLENGHLNVDGSRTQGKKHINDNADKIISETELEIMEVLK
jgi:hypothetical protein